MAKTPVKTKEANGNVPMVKEEKEHAVAAWADDLATCAGEGLEDVQSTDMALPFFKLLQSLSREVKRSEAAYIEGAEEGMWCDVIGKETWDEIVFVPAKFMTQYIEWHAKVGEGLVANHGTDSSVLAKCKKDEKTGQNVTPDGTIIVPTATWFGIVIEGTRGKETVPVMKRAVLTLAGTQTKVSRRWVSDAASIRMVNSQGKPFTPPLYAMTYRLGASPTKNDQGSWFLATVSRAGWLLDYENGKELFKEAQEFSKLAQDLKPTHQDDSEGAPRDNSEPRVRPQPEALREEDANIPF